MVESLQMFVFLFKSKYRRKFWCSTYISAVFIILFIHCLNVSAQKCTESNCINGVCKNDTCVCNDGWQGPECQFCGGKVRLAEPYGSIHDGLGNYSIGVKCSWLIDAREQGPDGLPISAGYRGSNNATIRLHLEEFATECGWDHLYVYDGDSVDSPLLAVFSGLMYKDSYSIRRIPEIVAHSGSTLLHFFSDDAYNMSGFNISYRINACPSRDSSQNCSGHGICNEGVCLCDVGWLGSACDQPTCPGNCSSHLNQGLCDHEQRRCMCSKGFRGADCAQSASLGWWRSLKAKDFTPPGSAGHGSVVWKDSLHVVAGESYGKARLMYTYDFNGNVWETQHMEAQHLPASRYGASTVIYGDKIFMYGGVLSGGGGGVMSSGSIQQMGGACNELWAYDVSAKTWENITVRAEKCEHAYGMCGPLKSAGHTATLITSYDIKKSESMIVIFGHSPQFGYLNTVQEFNFGTREWRILETSGYPVKGGYGHSASYDYLTEKIYVYGGIISESESNQFLTAKLYSYDPKTRIWKLLTSAPSSRFLHTANFVSPGLMLVFGGNTHNDTSHSFGAKCYSNELLAYDVLCDSWHNLEIPKDLHADLSRFGHSAIFFEGALYIYGGFNGQMLSDILKYTPGDCTKLSSQYDCLNTRPGIKCVWDMKKNRCIPVNDVPVDYLSSYYEDYEMHYITCPEESRMSKAHMILTQNERCTELTDCYSCVQTSYDCLWCSSSVGGVCSRGKCRGDSISSDWGRRQIAKMDECPQDHAPVCRQLHTCHACRAHGGRCHWDYEMPKCRAVENRTVVDIQPGQPIAIARAESQQQQQHHVITTHHHQYSSPPLKQIMQPVSPVLPPLPPPVPVVLPPPCAPACAELASCHNCTQEECIWCQNEGRCVDKNAYTASFPYGQCREWTTVTGKCRSAVSGKSLCGFYSGCAPCRDDPACGWCDDGSGTGLGRCLPGGDRGPHDQDQDPQDMAMDDIRCPVDRWHFTACPSCQCNGHSTCSGNSSVCVQPCREPVMGLHCDQCQPGYWGNPVNGGKCIPCECNGQASQCNSETGKCYCTTKGLAGDHCEKCDANNHYHEDPNNKGSCYYDLTIDYQFTFNLSKKEDRHYTKINFRNSPIKPDIDADFTITCSVLAKMNISIKSLKGSGGQNGALDRPIFQDMNCTQFRHKFSKAEYNFGMEDNVTLTTFYVSVYDFQPPLWIQISFSQYPKLNLQQFFITFSTCFLLLLLVAAIMWKIKQKWDMYRRRQRLFVEMEQMASRPFSQVLVEIESKDNLVLSQESNNITTVRKRKKDSPSPIALEPCHGNRAAVLSLLVRLPTGGQNYTRCGQSAGLAIASALVTLGNPRKSSLDNQHQGKDSANNTTNTNSKGKRKGQSQHPADGCI